MILLLDTLAGVLLLTIALAGRRRARGTAAFALGAAVAWFGAPLAAVPVLLHRPLLVHAILALDARALRAPPARALLVVTWVGVALPTAAQPVVSSASALLCAVTAAGLIRIREARLSPERIAARRALLVLAAGLALPVVQRALWSGYAESRIPLATYLCSVSLCAVVMLVGLLAPSRHEDAVIELADASPADGLAQLHTLGGPDSGSALIRARDAALALLEDNARLQRDLTARIEEVRASRQRLVSAAVDERRRLEQVLADGARRYLDELEDCLEATPGAGRPDPAVAACLEEIGRARDDLEQLGRGLHPRRLTEGGLPAALEELGRHSPVPIQVRAPAERFPTDAETAVWYVCAEAVANAWKHARATRVVVEVTAVHDRLCARVGDDGVGGATLAPGGGLAGLLDRLAAVGGALDVTSSGGGTVVTAEVPVR